MTLRPFLFALTVAGFVLAGCIQSPTADPNSLTDPNNLGSDPNTNTGDSGLSLRGTLAGAASAKRAPNAQANSAGLMVVAQNAETGEMFTAVTDDDGAFEIDIPDGSSGAPFMVTIIGQDAQPFGPVVFGASGNDGYTGLELNGPVSLGTINLPEDPGAAPIQPGTDNDIPPADIPTDITARLGAGGAPVGVASFGKGDAADGATSTNPRLATDKDRDGLIDMFDADNDGDGIVDDFDPDGAGLEGMAAGLSGNFFMNLKIGPEQANTYYTGSPTAIENRIKTDTVITFEVRGESILGKNITAVHAMPTPAPTYLSSTTVLGTANTWSTSSFAFTEDGSNHFQAFIVPNSLIRAGDSFTVEVEFDDGTTKSFTRMINFVFKNIPRLRQYGVLGSLSDYTTGDTVNFDGTQDLTLVFNPPVDETGAYLTDLDYRFEIFFQTADHQQLNQDIDKAATWPTPPTGFSAQNLSVDVSKASLTLSGDNTYTVTLPKEIFVDTVQTSGGPVSVAEYQIDIAAQSNGNNAAIKLFYVKM